MSTTRCIIITTRCRLHRYTVRPQRLSI